MRVRYVVEAFSVGAASVFLAVLGAYEFGYLGVFPSGIHHIELLSLFLAAATVVMTMVAIALAVAAVVGYNAVKEAAERRAEEAASKLVKEYIDQIGKSPETSSVEGAVSSGSTPEGRPGAATKEGDTL